MGRLAAVFIVAILLASCAGSEAKQFGVETPKVLWDAQGSAWIVEHHVGDVFRVRRLAELDKPIATQ